MSKSNETNARVKNIEKVVKLEKYDMKTIIFVMREYLELIEVMFHSNCNDFAGKTNLFISFVDYMRKDQVVDFIKLYPGLKDQSIKKMEECIEHSRFGKLIEGKCNDLIKKLSI